ncbi:MAG: HepT-like ribonuclease domain-containing protein [Armatimonadota bacterium]
MMLPRDITALMDIRHHATQALTYVAGMTADAFYQDAKTQDAVLRKLEIIGEAARRLSEGARTQLHSIPWHEWISLRNRLIHTYDAVDLSIVWTTVSQELPQLVTSIEALLAA